MQVFSTKKPPQHKSYGGNCKYQPSTSVDLFSNLEESDHKNKAEHEFEKRERSLQNAMIGIKERFGKNAILKGLNFKEGATTIERNGQVGGHRA